MATMQTQPSSQSADWLDGIVLPSPTAADLLFRWGSSGSEDWLQSLAKVCQHTPHVVPANERTPHSKDTALWVFAMF